MDLSRLLYQDINGYIQIGLPRYYWLYPDCFSRMLMVLHRVLWYNISIDIQIAFAEC